MCVCRQTSVSFSPLRTRAIANTSPAARPSVLKDRDPAPSIERENVNLVSFLCYWRPAGLVIEVKHFVVGYHPEYTVAL